jgi:hypothetical protein
MKPKIEINQLIERAANKHHELFNAAEKLRTNRHKFIACGMIDHFLTQISPSALAEYTNARKKGNV